MRVNKPIKILTTTGITLGLVGIPAIAHADEVSPEATTQSVDVAPVAETAPAPEVVAPAPEPAPVVTPEPQPAPAPVVEVAPAPAVAPSSEPVVDQSVVEPAPESAPQPVAKSTPEVAAAQVQQVVPVVPVAPADTVAPTVTIKPESIGKDSVHRSISFKLYDAGKVDYVKINGVVKDLSNNVYSDLNGVKPGVYGAVQGTNTLEVYDVAGNMTVVVFSLDTAGPTFTVKPEGTTGADGIYQKLSVKLFDSSKVDKAIINGVEKDLTDNVWSDLNNIVPGVFGAKEGLNTLVLVDALGNQSTYTFTLDTTKPVINTPAGGQWVSGTHTWTITQDEANPAKAYVEIQQLVGGKWQKFQGFEIKDSNDLTATFDTTKLTSGVETQIKISSTDKAGNHTSKTFSVNVDNVAPTITVKPESIGWDGVFSDASFKLFDGLSGVDKVFVNGVEKDLTNNKWSDLNGLVPGKFGAVEGWNTIVLQDVAGNTVTLEVFLDVTAPTVVDVQNEWQAERNRESITVTFSEPVFDLPQGWYGSGTVWTKVFYNTKLHTLTFTDQAGNHGAYTITPQGAPVVEEPEPTDPETPSEPEQPTDPTEPTEPSNPEEPGDTEEPGTWIPGTPILPETPDGSEAPVEQPTTGDSPEDYTQGDDVTPVSYQLPSTTQSSSQTSAASVPQKVTPVQHTLAHTGAGTALAAVVASGLLGGGGFLKRFSIRRSR